MSEELIPLIVIPVFFGTIAFVVRVLSDNRVKRELISMKADREIIDYLMLQAPQQNNESSLKWGIVSVALGAALALIHLMGLSGEDPMTFALLFIFGGGGLLCHYALRTGSEDSD
jgi:hypothetical protein